MSLNHFCRGPQEIITVRGPDILRDVIVSEYVRLFQINKFFETISFHFDKMASRAAFSSPAIVWKPLVYSHFQHIHVFCVCIKRKNRDPRENEKLRKCKISYKQLTFYRETDCDKLSAIMLNFAEAVRLYFYLKIHSSQCTFLITVIIAKSVLDHFQIYVKMHEQ